MTKRVRDTDHVLMPADADRDPEAEVTAESTSGTAKAPQSTKPLLPIDGDLDTSGESAARESGEIVEVDEYQQLTNLILEGLEEVDQLVPGQMTYSQVDQVCSKYNNSRFLLIRVALKMDKVFPSGLAKFNEELGRSGVLQKQVTMETKLSSLSIVSEPTGDGAEEVPLQFDALIQLLASVLASPCGDMGTGPRVKIVADAVFCKALGGEILELDPKQPLPSNKVTARVMAVATQFGGYQGGRGYRWLTDVILSGTDWALSENLDPAVVYINPLPANLAATLAGLPVNDGSFAGGRPVSGFTAPVGHPHAALPPVQLHHQFISCARMDEAHELVAVLHAQHVHAVAAPGAFIVVFNLRVPPMFPW